ncbi:hypothetical protein BT96DRAFT_45892 [Gymnopus androsaceus JB14]|uniref:Uncharacterized protein n=1 Tax=Gymnopus androsaceus JB14 TaxID=1447944 RepID=A0A6A4GD69_9AGAR|nr:hypothetical protein BT96DRAFT_45892 [Gymnopus androsaceus JB14]
MHGHDHWVSSAAFSPDGARVVSASSDKTLRIWDATTGAQISDALQGHDDYVTSVAFSPDGTRIVSGSHDKTLRIWDGNTGAQIGDALQGHDDYVTSVAFSPDGTRIVSGSSDNTLRIWDATTGAQIGESLQGHDGTVKTVAFSLDSHRIVSGSSDETLRIWDVSAAIVESVHVPESWFLSSDGWVCYPYDPNGIVWIPPQYRKLLWRPKNTCIISRYGFTKLSLDACVYGTNWMQCFGDDQGEENPAEVSHALDTTSSPGKRHDNEHTIESDCCDSLPEKDTEAIVTSHKGQQGPPENSLRELIVNDCLLPSNDINTVQSATFLVFRPSCNPLPVPPTVINDISEDTNIEIKVLSPSAATAYLDHAKPDSQPGIRGPYAWTLSTEEQGLALFGSNIDHSMALTLAEDANLPVFVFPLNTLPREIPSSQFPNNLTTPSDNDRSGNSSTLNANTVLPTTSTISSTAFTTVNQANAQAQGRREPESDLVHDDSKPIGTLSSGIMSNLTSSGSGPPSGSGRSTLSDDTHQFIFDIYMPSDTETLRIQIKIFISYPLEPFQAPSNDSTNPAQFKADVVLESNGSSSVRFLTSYGRIITAVEMGKLELAWVDM